jgi:PAS domain S-box-containing protein
MGALMRALDWSTTPLGPVEGWPQSLRTAVSIMLASGFPMIIFWGPEYVALYNDAYIPVFGQKHPAALGRRGRECWPEVWEKQLGPMFGQVVSEGEAIWSEDLLFYLDRNGYLEETFFTLSYSAIRDESGKPGGVLATVFETTERVLADRRMKTLRELAAHASGSHSVEDACARALATLRNNPDDVPFASIQLFEGEERWPEAAQGTAVVPIAHAGGEATLGAFVAGINPRRAYDAAYQTFFELIASQIATAVTNARVYEAERERAEALAQIDRAKTAFFSNVSHEFRTPLTLMLGPTEAALGASEPALRGAELEMVYRNQLRLLKLVNALLDFSRIEAGRAQATYRPTDIAALTRELAGAFRSAVESAGLRFEVACDPIAAEVYVDHDMWEKVVLNLLSNAVKFTFEGGLRVGLREVDGHVELIVQDSGTGIAEDEVPRVFDRFHRIEGARSRTHEGSGIGLALTSDLVRLHGGTIGVTSTPGVGSTFTVRIPTGRAHLPDERVSTEPAHRPAGSMVAPFTAEMSRWMTPLEAVAAPSGVRRRILVADDNADMRDYMRQLLRDFDVETVANGALALERARATQPDLILTDVMMPELDGFGLLTALRADMRTSAIPVLMLSARSGEEARVSGLAAGADDYVTKPFSARELAARVQSLLSLADARRQADLQKQHLHSLFMQAPTPIVILRGRDHVVELANPQTCELWGRRQEEVVGRPLLDVLPELRGQPFPRLLDQVLQTGQPHFGKEQPARLDRLGDGAIETAYLNFVYQPLRGLKGDIEGVLVIAFDVTDEVRARDEMNTLRALEQSANRTKDEFLAMLGHELRNPLAPILTALQLMTLRGDAGAERERTVIDRQVRHLVRLVDDLLDVSRIARGRVDLRREPVELSDVIASAIEGASPLLEERQHHLELHVPRTGLLVSGDVTRLTQVVANIITNAAKYTEPRGRITVSARNTGGRVELRVKDTGIGISRELLSNIFEMFSQDRQAIDRSRGGLGLGLTIARNLVELHDGTIEARSDGRGKGSEFIITLPALATETPAAVNGPAVEQRLEGAKRTGRRVLVVDDNPDAARLTAAALETVGHETRVAFDGPAAIALASTFVPHAVLLDLGLPLMDGFEVARQLRAAAVDGVPPLLIAVTGYGQASDRARTEAAGFQAHVVKPVDVHELVSLLDAFLDPALPPHH